MHAVLLLAHLRGWAGAKNNIRLLPVLSWTCHALKRIVKPFLQTHILCFPQVFGSYSHIPTAKFGHLLVPGQNMICSINRECHSLYNICLSLHKTLPKCSTLSLLGASPGDVCTIWDVLPPVWGVTWPPLFRSLLDDTLIKCAVYYGVKSPTVPGRGPSSRITVFGRAGFGLFVFSFQLHCINIWANSYVLK